MSEEQPILVVRKSDLLTYVLVAAILGLGAYVFSTTPKRAGQPSVLPGRCLCGARCNCAGTGSLVAPKGAVINELRAERPKGAS